MYSTLLRQAAAAGAKGAEQGETVAEIGLERGKRREVERYMSERDILGKNNGWMRSAVGKMANVKHVSVL